MLARGRLPSISMSMAPPNGNLARYGLVQLLNDLRSGEYDGVLRLHISDLTVRLYLQGGTPVFCVSSSPTHSLPAFLVRQRAVDSDVLDEMVDRARRERQRLDEVLRNEKLVSTFQMSAIKQSLGQSILSNLFDQSELNYQLDGGRLPPGMEALSLDPVRAFFRSLRDDDVFDLDSALAEQQNQVLLKGPEWDTHTRSLTSVFRAAEDVMVQLADGTVTLAMLKDALDSSDCSRLVFAMLQTGMIALGERDESLEPEDDIAEEETETEEETESGEPSTSAEEPTPEDSAFFLDDGSVEDEFAKLVGNLEAGLVSLDREEPSQAPKKRRSRDDDDAPSGIAVSVSQAVAPEKESAPPSSKPLPSDESVPVTEVQPPDESVPDTEVQPAEEAPVEEEAAAPAKKKADSPTEKVPPPPAFEEDHFDEEDPSDLLGDFMEDSEPSSDVIEDPSTNLMEATSTDLLDELTAVVASSGGEDSGKAKEKKSRSRAKEVRAKGFDVDDLPDDPILRGVAKDRARMAEESAFRIFGVPLGACLSEIRESHKKLKAQYEVSKYEGRYLPDSSREDLVAIADRLDDVLRELCVPARRLALESKESGPLGKKRIVRYFQAERRYQKGRQQYRSNQKRMALKAFRAAAAEYDRDPIYHTWCGFVLWELLEDEAHGGVEGRVKVREYLAAALALNKNFTMALLLSARLARHEGDTDTALEMYDRVLEINPRSAEARTAVRELDVQPEPRAASKAKEKLSGLFRRKKD
jgi:hypothetical protein